MSALFDLAKLLPWRIRHRIDVWLENDVRRRNHKLYKWIKYGRTNLNTPEYWNAEWSSDNQQRDYDELFGLILERIPERAIVLDVGCGVGRLSRLMRNKRNADVTGLDFSSWACEQLQKDGFKTVVSSLPDIPLPNASFDVALATEVLEHIDGPEKTLVQMARVVRPGGLLMCSVPNNMLHPYEELEHQQSYDQDRLRALLSPFGKDIEIRTGRLLRDSDLEFLFGCVRI